MRRGFFILLLAVLGAVPALGDAPQSFLPANFDGWQRQADKVTPDATAADPANAALLKEYGLTAFEEATYVRRERRLEVRAARFGDLSGAYGAYSFYRTGDMQRERLGDRGASAGLRVLVQKGNVLVTVKLDRVTAMSAAELRDLADALPPARGGSSLPTIPNYLPEDGYITGTARYIVGPVGLQASGTPIPPDVVDFGKGAEAAAASYSTSRGTATTLVIAYPTPQIAAEHLRSIVAFLQSNALAGGARNDQFAKRSGPIVAVVTGDVNAGEAKSLLSAINYDADVTWNQNTYFNKRENVANLLVNIVYLIGILLLFALVLGIFFGGIRLLAKRLFPNKVFDRPEDVEIIQLKLRG